MLLEGGLGGLGGIEGGDVGCGMWDGRWCWDVGWEMGWEMVLGKGGWLGEEGRMWEKGREIGMRWGARESEKG
jgi:hypothetical protein